MIWAARQRASQAFLTSELTGSSTNGDLTQGAGGAPWSMGVWAELGQQTLGGLAGWKTDSGDVPEMILPGRAGQRTWVGQQLRFKSMIVSNRLVFLLPINVMHRAPLGFHIHTNPRAQAITHKPSLNTHCVQALGLEMRPQRQLRRRLCPGGTRGLWWTTQGGVELESDSGARGLGASSICSVMLGESLTCRSLSFLHCQMEVIRNLLLVGLLWKLKKRIDLKSLTHCWAFSVQ